MGGDVGIFIFYNNLSIFWNCFAKLKSDNLQGVKVIVIIC